MGSKIEDKKERQKPVGFKSTFASVGAAFFGVQSDKKRQRDFSEGKFMHFAIAGVISVIIFITVLIGIVNMVLPN